MCWHPSETLVRLHRRARSQVCSNDHLDWTSKQITYGLYLSDHSILDDIETELTVLSGIMIQNLPRETAWHLRGTRRIGVSIEDVETLQQCVRTGQPRVLYLLMTLDRACCQLLFLALAQGTSGCGYRT
jgi:hypothetical protein